MTVSSDRWTCPDCRPGHGTVVVVGSDADTAAAIHAVQLRHGQAHARANRVLNHLGIDHKPTVHEAVPNLVIAPTSHPKGHP